MTAVTIVTNRTPLPGARSGGHQDTAARGGSTTRPSSARPAAAAGRARPGPRVSRAAYVRRRLSVAVMAAGLVLVTAQAGAALGGSSRESSERAPAVATAVVTVVRPGDSLWSLAQRLAPDRDPRPVVDALREARRGSPLLVGETVRWVE